MGLSDWQTVWFGIWWWWYYPTPSEGWVRGGTPRRPNSWATPQGLDQRSRIEREEPKIDLRRGSEAGQSRRRWLRSCGGCPQALHLHQRPATSSWWCSPLPNGDGSKGQDRSPEGLGRKVAPIVLVWHLAINNGAGLIISNVLHVQFYCPVICDRCLLATESCQRKLQRTKELWQPKSSMLAMLFKSLAWKMYL